MRLFLGIIYLFSFVFLFLWTIFWPLAYLTILNYIEYKALIHTIFKLFTRKICLSIEEIIWWIPNLIFEDQNLAFEKVFSEMNNALMTVSWHILLIKSWSFGVYLWRDTNFNKTISWLVRFLWGRKFYKKLNSIHIFNSMSCLSLFSIIFKVWLAINELGIIFREVTIISIQDLKSYLNSLTSTLNALIRVSLLIRLGSSSLPLDSTIDSLCLILILLSYLMLNYLL